MAYKLTKLEIGKSEVFIDVGGISTTAQVQKCEMRSAQSSFGEITTTATVSVAE